MIDVSSNKFTVNTYRTDTMEKIDTEFTIIKDSTLDNKDTTTETTTATITTESNETTTVRRASSGAGASKITVKGYSKAATTTESTTEEVTEENKVTEAIELTTEASLDIVKVSVETKMLKLMEKLYQLN